MGLRRVEKDFRMVDTTEEKRTWKQPVRMFKDVVIDDPRFKLMKDQFNILKGRVEEKKENLAEAEKIKEASQKRYDIALKTRALFQLVAQQTQGKLQYHISNLVTLAEAAVFDDPYKFVARFELRRGKTECDLLFEKDGAEFKPVLSSGGGALDVASFALLGVNQSLVQKRSVLVLDEPFRFLSKDLQSKAADMIKMLSEKLGIQFIIVSHVDELVESADKVFEVVKGGQVSKVVSEG